MSFSIPAEKNMTAYRSIARRPHAAKHLMVIGLFALSSCAFSDPNDPSSLFAGGYSLHPELQPWQDAHIPYSDIAKWQGMGFTADDAVIAYKEGLTGPDEVAPWYHLYSPTGSTAGSLPGLLITYAAGSRNAFTPQDVSVVLGNTGASFLNYEEVSALARLVHNGTPGSDLTAARASMKREAIRNNEAAQKRQRDAEAAEKAREKQALVDRYGADNLSACNGKVVTVNMVVTNENLTPRTGFALRRPSDRLWAAFSGSMSTPFL